MVIKNKSVKFMCALASSLRNDQRLSEIALSLFLLGISLVVFVYGVFSDFREAAWVMTAALVMAFFAIIRPKRISVGKDGIEIEAQEKAKVVEEVEAATLNRNPDSDQSIKDRQVKEAYAVLEKLNRKTRKRILWVDDYPDNNVHEISMLLPLGLEIIQATSTKAAQIYIKNNKFDLVISDMGREEAGSEHAQAGIDIIKQIDSKMPVVIYMGDKSESRASLALKAGAKAVEDMPVGLLKSVVSNLYNIDC